MEALGLPAILEIAHTATTLEDYEARVLPILRQQIACDQIFFADRRGASACALGFDERVRRQTAGRFEQYAVELAAFARAAAGKGGVGVDVDFFGDAALQRTAHYREVMRPHDGRSSLLGYLCFRGQKQRMIVFGRSTRGFRETEQRWLREALPALSLAQAALAPRAAASAKPLSPDTERLSPREREVLSYLVLGYTNAEIALACGTSFRTVRNQLTSVFQKLGASTRAEAVAIGLRE
jgi:DNA-binding CsgD family transcriptional regulator